jgi:hypothetical protein
VKVKPTKGLTFNLVFLWHRQKVKQKRSRFLVMLFFASAVAAKPELEQYRFEILTALWCRYSSASVVNFQRRVPLPTAPASTTLKALGSPTVPTSSTEDKALSLEPADKSTERLVEWLAFATFGSHATQYEVDKCLSRSSLWLPKLTSKTLQSEVPHDHFS